MCPDHSVLLSVLLSRHLLGRYLALEMENEMNDFLMMIRLKAQGLINGEEGQDLVEYALLIALVSLAAVAGLNGIATAISSVFSSISTSLTAA